MRRIKELYHTLGGGDVPEADLPAPILVSLSGRRAERDAEGVFGEATLGDARLRTLLMMVLRNETTDSPWPLSNATGARFNDRSRPDCNLDLPLWQLVRGSTAAPIYFPAEVIRVGGRRLVFADGGLTSFNNPAFQLFLMATLNAYGLSWPTGVDSLLPVSVGTGYHPNAHENLKLSRLHVLHNVRSAPSALMFAALIPARRALPRLRPLSRRRRDRQRARGSQGRVESRPPGTVHLPALQRGSQRRRTRRSRPRRPGLSAAAAPRLRRVDRGPRGGRSDRRRPRPALGAPPAVSASALPVTV